MTVRQCIDLQYFEFDMVWLAECYLVLLLYLFQWSGDTRNVLGNSQLHHPVTASSEDNCELRFSHSL